MNRPQVQDIHIDDLLFDPDNPRLPLTRRSNNNSEVFEYLIKKENLFDLMASIGVNGFYPTEPLIAVPSNDDAGKFVVVEGNRRLAALKLLSNPGFATIKRTLVDELVETAIFKPTTVPVVVNASREEVLDYLGYRHITGVEEWDSLSKARYLSQLYDFHAAQPDFTAKPDVPELYRKLARIIGSRADYVNKLIRGYKIYSHIHDQEYYDIDGLNEETFSFSLLTTAISYGNISDFISLSENDNVWKYNDERLGELVTWIFEKGPENVKRVPDSRDLQTLNKIVVSEKALSIFREGKPLDYARRFTDEPKEFFQKAIDEAFKLVEDAHNQAHLIADFTEQDLNDVTRLITKTKDLNAIIRGRLDQD